MSRRVEGSTRSPVHREPRDVRVAVRVGVVHVELVATRCEGEPQEPLLTSEGHVVGEIDHGHPVDGPPGPDRHDLPRLLGHVERVVAGPDRHRQRLVERRNQHQSDPNVGELRRRGRSAGCGRSRRRGCGARGRTRRLRWPFRVPAGTHEQDRRDRERGPEAPRRGHLRMVRTSLRNGSTIPTSAGGCDGGHGYEHQADPPHHRRPRSRRYRRGHHSLFDRRIR